MPPGRRGWRPAGTGRCPPSPASHSRARSRRRPRLPGASGRAGSSCNARACAGPSGRRAGWGSRRWSRHKEWNVVVFECGIGRGERERFQLRYCYEQPIERIAMMIRQVRDPAGVTVFDGQRIDAVTGQSRLDEHRGRLGKGQLAQAVLDCNLPGTRHREYECVVRVSRTSLTTGAIRSGLTTLQSQTCVSSRTLTTRSRRAHHPAGARRNHRAPRTGPGRGPVCAAAWPPYSE